MNLMIKRRQLLAGTAMAMGAMATGRLHAQETADVERELPEYVAFKQPDALIVHSNNTIETRRDAFGTALVTPEDKLYVRNNVNPPPASILDDRDSWEVSIEGVGSPGSLTVGELKQMGIESVTMVLQCSGNGRAFFDHETSGTQWQVGAAGNVMWTGVPLRTVVEALGGADGAARFVTGTGGEEFPEGAEVRDVIVERSVPIEAFDTILLAWELNGEPISLAHGGPLRMIVPGYTGVNNVKYVKRIALTEAESDAAIQQSRYRLNPVGEEGGPEWPSVWEMNVKSWINQPLADRAAGPVVISGVAFGGINAVEKVEVSLDGGQSWQEAVFVGPDLGQYAWRTFALPTELAPGQYTIVSRATDSQGNAQPEVPEANDAGYNHNGWRGPAVEIVVS